MTDSTFRIIRGRSYYGVPVGYVVEQWVKGFFGEKWKLVALEPTLEDAECFARQAVENERAGRPRDFIKYVGDPA